MAAETFTFTVVDAAGHTSAAKTLTVNWGNPQPPAGRRIGVYMSGNNTGLDALTSGWPKKPNLASFYVAWSSGIPSLMSTYASQGRVIQVELATKFSGGYKTWANIAAGTEDTAIASFVGKLDALPGTAPVWLSLDNEADIKATSGTGEVQAGQTAAQYVAAANRFADIIHANSTRVQSMVWLAGGTAATAASFLPAKTKLDHVGWDPYKKGTELSDTPTTLFAKFVNAVLVPKGYDQIPRHILETGIKVDPFSSGGSYTVQQQKDFYAAIPAGMDANQIQSVIWFRANSGAHDYIPLDPSVDAAFRDMLADAI